MSDGNLSWQLTTLETVGYIQMECDIGFRPHQTGPAAVDGKHLLGGIDKPGVGKVDSVIVGGRLVGEKSTTRPLDLPVSA